MRKVIVLLLLCLLTCVSAWASPFAEKDVKIGQGLGSAEPSAITGTVEVTGNVLNVRAGPWGKIIGQLGNGVKVKIVGSSGDWFKISHNGNTCYVHKNFVSAPGHKASQVEPAQKAASANTAGKVSTGGPTLNVRSGPWGTIVGSLSNNAAVTIVGESGVWYKISYAGTTRYVHKDFVSTGSRPVAAKPATSNPLAGSTYKASVVGAAQGDGTVAGALTWARDQINGAKNGYNLNNGMTSKNPASWSGWCLAFVNTAYGRSKPLLSAPSAIKSYYQFKAAGKINTNKTPPAGAAIFTGTTSGNPYGHIFISTGKMNGPNDPIIITTTSSGIKEMPMSQMWKGPAYLGWAMP